MLVCPCLSLTEKQGTIRFSVSFTRAAFKAFTKACLCFLVSASPKKKKKNAESIKFLGILKNMTAKIKFIFALKRTAIFHLIKNIYFCASHDFQT